MIFPCCCREVWRITNSALHVILICLTVRVWGYCQIPSSPCTTCAFTWIRSTTECGQYFVCYDGNPYTFWCPPTLVFSMSIKACVNPNHSQNDCDIRPNMGGLEPKTPPNNNVDYMNKQPTCGVKIDRRIVGGLPSSPGEWPWMVSLQFDYGNGDYRHFCGAALIDDRWIVTAGHCVKNYPRGKMIAVMGMHRLSMRGRIQRGIIRVIVHDGFVNSNSYPNDIAMLELADRVDLEDVSVGKVCLPERNEEFVEGSCWVTGWGITKGTGDDDVLNELRVGLIDRTNCSRQWNGFIRETHVCVGNGDNGACKGDSGSPLVCFRRGAYVLAGITSWGSWACNTPGFPNVYTRVSSYVDWIDSEMRRYARPV